MQDFDALAAIEKQALASRGGGGGVGTAVETTTIEKQSNNGATAKGKTVAVVDGRCSSLAIAASLPSAGPPQPVIDLTLDSPRENRSPAASLVANAGTGKQKAGETVAMRDKDAAAAVAAATTSAAAAAPPLPPPPPAPPVRHLTLADVSKPPDLVALPWLHAEIKLDRYV